MISGTLNSAPVAQLPAITSVQQQILGIKMQHNVCQEITGRKKINQLKGCGCSTNPSSKSQNFWVRAWNILAEDKGLITLLKWKVQLFKNIFLNPRKKCHYSFLNEGFQYSLFWKLREDGGTVCWRRLNNSLIWEFRVSPCWWCL